MDALMLIEALLIIAAVLAFKAVRFFSPSLHAFHPAAVDSSNNDTAPISMDSSSSSSAITDAPPPAINIKYDVFLSFRGEDTRYNFTSHLYEALCKAKIETFIDDKLHKGGEISPELLRAIEESKISVIIFSQDYASSTWCLDELVKILECKQKYGRVVVPIFYHVEPSIIRKQRGSYGDAFIKHEQRFKDNKEKLQKWREALTRATNLSGWDSKNIRGESKLIKKIVRDILSKLNGLSSCHFEGLVGIDHHIKEIEELLSEVHVVGIWGMGGIGKTTLAKVVSHKLKPQFASFSFVENVREQLATIGLDQLQKKCLSELLEDKDIDTYYMRSTSVKNRLQHKKVLLVLDDVDNSIKAEDLIKLGDWFGQGSRIIITSRDRQVLKNATPYDGAYETYHVQEMDSHDALPLFSLRAFKQTEPAEDYVELSDWVVNYCQGNPLALIVLGSFLYRRRKEEWESALEKLKQAPHKDIFNVLKLSFDGLDDKQKNMFLDMVCFFRGSDKLHKDYIGDYYDSSAYIEISVLEDRSLISIGEFGYIEMHDLVKEMGQEIAHQQYINKPRKPIRLWKHEDIYRLLKNNQGTETIQGLSLDMCKIKEIHLKADVFEKMYNLRILEFYKSNPREPSKVCISEGLDILPEELRILHWVDYPLPNVPLSFCAENLVKLEMCDSHLRQLWDRDQHFPKLRIINLCGSKLLIGLPDLSRAPNIKEILLDDCVNLLEINSTKSLDMLSKLSLARCNKLRSAEILTVCNQLRLLEWGQCPLQALPLTYCLRNLVELSICGSKLDQLWNGQQHFPHLEKIDLRGSKDLIRMPDLSQAPNIRYIDLRDCTSLLQLYSSSLLFKLWDINLDGCSKLRRVKIYSIKLEYLRWDQCPLQSLPLSFFQQEQNSLVYLSIGNSEVQKLWNENQHFPKLKAMNLSGCKHLIELPDLSAQTPNIEHIDVVDCVDLVRIHSSSIPVQLGHLHFKGCNKLRSVNLGCNVHLRSLGTLVIACNYFDLKNLVFSKVSIRVFLSDDDGSIYAFGFKAESVPFNDSESEELKLLGQSLSSLLPFVAKLRCSNIISSSTEFGNFCTHYRLDLDHHNLVTYPQKQAMTTLTLRRTASFLKVKSLTEVRTTREVGSVLGLENSTQLDCDCDCDIISKVPNTITRWFLLTDLSLQESDIASLLGSIPGISSLKSLAESYCLRLLPVIDLTIPLKAKASDFTINFGQELNQRDSNDARIVYGDSSFFFMIIKTQE